MTDSSIQSIKSIYPPTYDSESQNLDKLDYSKCITIGTYQKRHIKTSSQTKCVMHLIDFDQMELFDFDTGSFDSIDQFELNELENMARFISQHHSELWDVMKRGDLIKDVSISSDNEILNPTVGVYVVDKLDFETNEISGIHIIRNGLTIRNLHKDSGKGKITRYNIPSDMYSITQFPLGYFDDIVINDEYSPYYHDPRTISLWYSKCMISLDKKALKINKNTKVFHKTKNVLYEDRMINVDYLYVVLKFNNEKYMIISEYVPLPTKYNIAKEKLAFIKKLRKQNLFELEDIVGDVESIAKAHKIDSKNIVCV